MKYIACLLLAMAMVCGVVQARTTISLAVDSSRDLEFGPSEHALDVTGQRSWIASSSQKLYAYPWSNFNPVQVADLEPLIGDRDIAGVIFYDNEDGTGLLAVVAGTYRSSTLFDDAEPFRSTLSLFRTSANAADTVLLASFTIGYDVQSASFSPGGNWLVCVCQGQVWRTSDTSAGTGGWFDPKGEVYIFDVSDQSQLGSLDISDATIVDWSEYNQNGLPNGFYADVSPVKPAAAPTPTVADLALPNAGTWVSENQLFVSMGNNGITVIDPRTGNIERMWPFGLQDIGSTGFDSSDEDGGILIREWPNVKALRAADQIIYAHNRIWTANEGVQAPSATTLGFADRVENFESSDFATSAFPSPAAIQQESALGRLLVYTLATLNNNNQFTELLTLGGREITSFKTNGDLQWSSQSELETQIASDLPAGFNTNTDADSADSRSPVLGPEVEAVVAGRVETSDFLFTIGDKSSIINVWNIDDPDNPRYETTFVNRNFLLGASLAGDVGALQLYFLDKDQSANGNYQLVCAFEDSDTYSFYRIDFENLSPASALWLSFSVLASVFLVFLIF